MDPSARSAASEIERAIAARFPVIYVVTWEEERLGELLEEASKKYFGDNRPVWEWTSARGFISGPGREKDLTDPVAALAWLAESHDKAIVLMKDLPAHFSTSPTVVRAVRDAYDAMAGRSGTLVLSHPRTHVPPELGKELYLIELPLPGPDELLSQLRDLNALEDAPLRVSPEWLDQCSMAMQGLSSNEARDLFHQLVADQGSDTGGAVAEVLRARAQVLMKENCLEVVENTVDIGQVGGLKALKSWISTRETLFSREAREAGIRPPSGVLMMGVSGCGKSLAAKVIPAAWGLPLIRLDMNMIMSGAWGSPETAWERAIHAAEAAAPLVLWIDEIENSFGYQASGAPSGSMTVFSSFLTWMQEKPDDVFVAATANRIEILPAEMLRKGRFDQLFFVDLPGAKARVEILRIHISRQGGDPEVLDLDHLAELTEGWSPAEIEQMAKAARVDAFTHGREFGYDDLIQEAFRTVPLSKTMSEQLSALRSWARNRAVSA